MSLRIVLASACLAAMLTQEHAQPPGFRTGVDLVDVDVAVLDRQRRPIRGLTAADFTLLENGRPQEIVVFQEVHLPPPEPAAAAWMRDVVPDVRSNEPFAGRLLVLVLDDATLPADPSIVKTARTVARNIINGLGPHDLAAVVFTLNNRHAQDFTSDRPRLLAAVDRLSAGFIRKPADPNPGARRMGPPPGIGEDRLWYQYSIDAVRRAAEYLMEAPQRRKSLVYVSVGVPADFSPGGTEDGSAADSDAQRDLARDMQRAFAQAVRSNVTIFAIDPAGLQVTSARENRDFLRAISENTGGFAVTETNAPEAAVGHPRLLEASAFAVGHRAAGGAGGSCRAARHACAMLPVVPTTRRDFRREDAVTAFARVYQGGRRPLASATVAAVILDAAGQAVFRRTDMLTREWFTAHRAADYGLDLPVAQLSSGPHLLTIEVQAGKEAASGSVRFVIE